MLKSNDILMEKAVYELRVYDSATWYSTQTCSTLLSFNCVNGVLI
jgi:hypothetical protein